MKTFKTIIITLACSLALTACEDFLNITPEGQIKRDELLETPEGIEDALYGAYAQMRNQSLYGQELSFSTVELLAQTLTCEGNKTIEALTKYDYANTSVKGIFEGIWTAMYKNISNVNSILDAPLVASASEFPYTIYKGEALGLRAFMHFDLMRLFAHQITQVPHAGGIPYAKSFSLNTPPFESLAQNYEHILADLHEAERLLADEAKYVNTSVFMTDRQIHCNLYAVQALLARVYLTKGDKAKAAEYAQKVIDHSPYRLNDKTEVDGDLAGVLSRNETLFGIYFAEFYTNVYAKLEATTSYSSLDPRADIEEIYAQEEQGADFRKSANLKSVDRGGSATLRLSKLTDIYELGGNVSDRPKDRILGINLIRLPEMYYIMAEALLEATDTIGATKYFDCVLESRGLTALSARMPADTITQERINLEHFKEYIGEGYTFYNLKRQHLPIDAWDAKTNSLRTEAPDTAIYRIPIPDSEYANRY